MQGRPINLVKRVPSGGIMAEWMSEAGRRAKRLQRPHVRPRCRTVCHQTPRFLILWIDRACWNRPSLVMSGAYIETYTAYTFSSYGGDRGSSDHAKGSGASRGCFGASGYRGSACRSGATLPDNPRASHQHDGRIGHLVNGCKHGLDPIQP